MEDNKKELNESLRKSLSLMNFKPGMTRTDLTEGKKSKETKEQGIAGPAVGSASATQARQAKADDQGAIESTAKDYKDIDRFVRRIRRNADDLEKNFKVLANNTYQGKNALDAAKVIYKKKYNEDMPNWGDYIKSPQSQAQTTSKPRWPLCKGGINKVGCRSNAIAKVQALVGGLDDQIKIDGMFGKRTKAAIEKVAPEFAEQFTDADVATIKAKINAPQERAKEAAVTSSNERMANRIQTSNDRAASRALEPIPVDKIPTPRIEASEGATNMAIGFAMNESISQKERVKQNKENRKKIKLGLS